MRILLVAVAALGAVLCLAVPSGAAEPTYSITYDTCRGYFVQPIVIRRVPGNCKTVRVTYATMMRVVGKAYAAGARPQAKTHVTVDKPLKLFVRTIAKRGQRRHVQWKVECDNGDEDVRDGGGGFITRRSTLRSMPFPVPNPSTCTLDVSAQSNERGALRLRVVARFVAGEVAREEVPPA